MGMLFAGGELSDVVADASVSWTEVAGRFDAIYSRGSLLFTVDAGAFSFPLSVTSRQFFLSCIAWAGSSWRNDILQGLDANGDVVFKLEEFSTDDLRITVYNSSGVSIATDDVINMPSTIHALHRLGFSVDLSATGHVRFRFDDFEALAATGDFSGCNPVATIKIICPFGTTSQCAISEIIASTDDIRSARLKTLDLTANGTTQQWTGDVTDVNDAESSDVTLISSDAADEVATYAASNLPAGSVPVRAVAISARATRGATGPQNLAGAVRVGGTNYSQTGTQPSQGVLDVSQAFFETNPATGTAWERSAVDAAEFGVKSET